MRQLLLVGVVFRCHGFNRNNSYQVRYFQSRSAGFYNLFPLKYAVVTAWKMCQGTRAYLFCIYDSDRAQSLLTDGWTALKHIQGYYHEK